MNRIFLADLVELQANQIIQENGCFYLYNVLFESFKTLNKQADLRAKFTCLYIHGDQKWYTNMMLSFLNECNGHVSISVQVEEEQKINSLEKYVLLAIRISDSEPGEFQFTDLSDPNGSIERLPISISKQLIEKMGGSVSIEYQLGRKKEFIIKLNTKAMTGISSTKTIEKLQGQ